MIEIRNVTKNFDNVCAVNQVSLEIPEGSMFGLLGTNGAGKSTLLRMMAGILPCDAGTILLDGEGIYENPLCKEKAFLSVRCSLLFSKCELRGNGTFLPEALSGDGKGERVLYGGASEP